MDLLKEVNEIKEKKKIVILAHYYQDRNIQKVADYVGDSYYLSKIAAKEKSNTIVFCGVRFMAESAKILSPQKTVLIPDNDAKCKMVEMVNKKTVLDLKEKYPDAVVVSYINSSTMVKTVSDVCCTSSSAVKIVSKLENKDIIFVPDKNLGSYIQEKVPDKNIILPQGYCYVHNDVLLKQVENERDKNSEIVILVHPECRKEIRDAADFIGSTGQIINYVSRTNYNDYLIVTEDGIGYELSSRFRDKNFHYLNLKCEGMKVITLNALYNCLKNMENEIILDDKVIENAKISLEKMHLLGG